MFILTRIDRDIGAAVLFQLDHFPSNSPLLNNLIPSGLLVAGNPLPIIQKAKIP